MERSLLKSKIHRARITDANLNYEGSLTLDSELMEKADIVPYEKIEVVNINNGNRFATYVIKGAAGSGEVCLNGAAARLGHVGDTVILFTYANLPQDKIADHRPTIVLVDENNKIKSIQS